jgi:hypothetical protein
LTAIGFVLALVACDSGHAREVDTTTETIQSPVPSSPEAIAKRVDLFTRVLASRTRPASRFRLDGRPISPDSGLLAVQNGDVVNMVVFTGTPADLARIDLYGPANANTTSCYGGFDANGKPVDGSDGQPEDAAVLFALGGSCNRDKVRNDATLFRVGDSTLTWHQIRERTTNGTPIYIVDDHLSAESDALALIGSSSGRRALLITTALAANPAAGGIVEIATKDVHVVR